MGSAADAFKAVRIGGLTKGELLSALEGAGVRINELGRELFAHPGFTTSPGRVTIWIEELSVADLGLADGARIDLILRCAAQRGLAPCPLELGPHLRLQDRDQPEGATGQPPWTHRAPPGSVTVVSPPLAEEDDAPKGFYLRRIDGALWLRGYRSGPDHVWSPEDRLVFSAPAGALAGTSRSRLVST
jgi:hypothetical protein